MHSNSTPVASALPQDSCPIPGVQMTGSRGPRANGGVFLAAALDWFIYSSLIQSTELFQTIENLKQTKPAEDIHPY